MFKTINNGKLPTRGSKFSAAVDVYANEDVTIGAGETAIVGLGIAINTQKLFYSMPEYIQIAKNIELKMINCEDVGNSLFEETSIFIDDFLKTHYIALKPRSSIRAKGLISHSAVIDLDYKDEIKMIIYNPSSQKVYTDSNGFITEIESNDGFKINKGDRIGQLLLMEHKGYLFGIDSEEERTGGLGSTGK